MKLTFLKFIFHFIYTFEIAHILIWECDDTI